MSSVDPLHQTNTKGHPVFAEQTSSVLKKGGPTIQNRSSLMEKPLALEYHNLLAITNLKFIWLFCNLGCCFLKWSVCWNSRFSMIQPIFWVWWTLQGQSTALSCGLQHTRTSEGDPLLSPTTTASVWHKSSSNPGSTSPRLFNASDPRPAWRFWMGCTTRTDILNWGWVKTLVPSEPQNSCKWMFIPLKMYLIIGIDPYPTHWSRIGWPESRFVSIKMEFSPLKNSQYTTRRWLSFKDRKPLGELTSCDAWMAERTHWWTKRRLRLWVSLSLSISFCLCASLSLSLSLSTVPVCLSVLSVCLSVFLSINPFIHPSIHLNMCIYIYISLSLCICLPFYLFVYLSDYLSWSLSIDLSLYLSLSLSPSLTLSVSICLSLSIYLSVCISICLSIYPSVYLALALSSSRPAYLSFFLSIHQSIHPSIHLCLSLFLSLSLSLTLIVSI